MLDRLTMQRTSREAAMDVLAHLLGSLPPVAAAVVVLVHLLVRAAGRAYDRIEDRRGLEVALRDTRSAHRADVVRAYSETIGAARQQWRRIPPGS
jgi:hypothetical protein